MVIMMFLLLFLFWMEMSYYLILSYSNGCHAFFCVSDHISPIFAVRYHSVSLYLVLTLSFQNKIYKLQSQISNVEHGILNSKIMFPVTF